MTITDEQFAYVVNLLGLNDEAGAYFGLSAEETDAHRQALRDYVDLGDAAFLAMVDRERKAAEQRTEPLTPAERLRVEARRAIAMAVEEFPLMVWLASWQGTVH